MAEDPQRTQPFAPSAPPGPPFYPQQYGPGFHPAPLERQDTGFAVPLRWTAFFSALLALVATLAVVIFVALFAGLVALVDPGNTWEDLVRDAGLAAVAVVIGGWLALTLVVFLLSACVLLLLRLIGPLRAFPAPGQAALAVFGLQAAGSTLGSVASLFLGS